MAKPARARVVAEALTYLRNNKDRMRYDQYRKAGLPITSSHMESTVKMFNRRVKGTEKFWSENGAEADLATASRLPERNRTPRDVLGEQAGCGDGATTLSALGMRIGATIPVVHPDVESIDWMYLNVYRPRLQTNRGVAAFFCFHRGETFASSARMNPMSKFFVVAIGRFVRREKIPLITFTKGHRKSDVTHEYRSRFSEFEGIVVVGRAQEKTPSTVSMKTLALSSSSSALTFPTTPSLASTYINMLISN